MKKVTAKLVDTINPEHSHCYTWQLSDEQSDRRIDFVLKAAKHVGFTLQYVKGDLNQEIYHVHPNGSTHLITVENIS